jgi:hypothetical protein
MLHKFNSHSFYSRAVAQAVSHQALTTEAWVWSQASPRAIYGGQSGTGQAFLRVFLFSAVCMSPPLLQAHSIIYPRCYIILAADSVVKWHAYSSAKWLSPSHSRPLETKPKTGWIAEPFCTCYCTQSSQWSCPEPNMFGWVHNLTNMAQVNWCTGEQVN